MDELRQRLYDRTAAESQPAKHTLTNEPVNVTRNWNADGTPSSASNEKILTTPTDFLPKKHTYRAFILIGSLLIFIVVAGLSALFMYNGGNEISTDNIGISLTGPSAVGGGEVLALQIGLTNQNTVALESATLIVKYPDGTRSVNESNRDLYEDRIPINGIAAGEAKNVPIRVAVFGEENQEREIEATIEYRIEGSNGTFYKDATPFKFKINSSPLVLRVQNLEKVAAGQLVEVTITAQSNASNPLGNVLVTAQYPNGFRYESAEPAPVFGQNVWRISELAPEGTFEIKIKGIVQGLTDETFRINFDAGPAQSDNQFVIGSKIAIAGADFTIERPFLDIKIAIDGQTGDVVTIPAGKKSDVQIDVKNTLDETVYDMVIEVVPGGNALTEDSIVTDNGFYDSNTGTVRWETSSNPDFAQVFPGGTRTLSFDVNPTNSRGTASFELVVNIYARRVAESSAVEQLLGTVRTEAKYSSEILLGAQAGYNSSTFTDTGPVPPEVGETTTYTLTLVARAGVNDVTGAIVHTSLPVYIEWLDEYSGDGKVTYNNVSKQLEWDIDTIAANRQKELTFQVDILPSISQVDKTPILLNSQQLRANDRFTGVLLQANGGTVTTELSTEAGYEKGNGKVTR